MGTCLIKNIFKSYYFQVLKIGRFSFLKVNNYGYCELKYLMVNAIKYIEVYYYKELGTKNEPLWKRGLGILLHNKQNIRVCEWGELIIGMTFDNLYTDYNSVVYF